MRGSCLQFISIRWHDYVNDSACMIFVIFCQEVGLTFVECCSLFAWIGTVIHNKVASSFSVTTFANWSGDQFLRFVFLSLNSCYKAQGVHLIWCISWSIDYMFGHIYNYLQLFTQTDPGFDVKQGDVFYKSSAFETGKWANVWICIVGLRHLK